MRYRLARKNDLVPDGIGAFITDSEDGFQMNPLNSWHAKLIEDGSVVPIETSAEASSPRGKGDK